MSDPPSLSTRLEVFRSRTIRYQRLGYDRFAAARFVVECMGPLQGTALDVGTGKAVMASTLASLGGIEVVSVDIDDAERELAKVISSEAGVLPRIRFVTGDASRLPFGDGQFSSAVMLDVLHHLQDGVAVIGEMARVVSPGGVVAIADFTATGFELLDRVHRAEGGEHRHEGPTVDEAVAHGSRLGLQLVLRTEGHVHQVAILRRASGASDPKLSSAPA